MFSFALFASSATNADLAACIFSQEFNCKKKKKKKKSTTSPVAVAEAYCGWIMETVSVCGLHPGVAVTGFCPACLRDRLAGLHPPSDLRRCKSFSYYARSSSYLEPHPQQDALVLPDAADAPTNTKLALGSLGKRWQEWRRKSKLKHHHPPPATATDPALLARRSCDAFSTRTMLDEPRASYHPTLFVPRSDDQIPVEEEERAYVPGGSAQTRDYYLDSSSSSRRRRSVDRKSSSDAGDQIPRMVAAAANARVSPATELYHQPHTFHYHQPSFEPPPLLARERQEAKSKPKNKGIKGWSIWGLLHKKSSTTNSVGATASAFAGEARAAPPELRARGYDGQMLRCNSSVSARSSFSGIGSSFNGGRLGMRRADEVLLERNFSARYSSSSSCRYQFHKDDYSNSIANNSGAGAGSRPPRSSTLPRTSLGLYYY